MVNSGAKAAPRDGPAPPGAPPGGRGHGGARFGLLLLLASSRQDEILDLALSRNRPGPTPLFEFSHRGGLCGTP